MLEEWKAIEGFDGYFVSTLGRVSSTKLGITPKLKVLSKDRYGYNTVNLSYPKSTSNPSTYKKCKVYRLVYEAFVGPIPRGLSVDHINRVKHDDNVLNLRLTTSSQNNMNTVGRSKCGFKGVYTTKNKNSPYRASIYARGRSINLGSFKTKEEGALAYNTAAIEYFGAYACLNEVL
jgi:hypothetical protein